MSGSLIVEGSSQVRRSADAARGTKASRPADSALFQAQRDYGAFVRQTPGVLESDVDTDLVRFGLIASGVADLARKAWGEYRKTDDLGFGTEFDLAAVASRLANGLAADLGFSLEAVEVLDAMVVAEFSI